MKDWLKSIAPAIGTALGGPLGGAAAAFLADKLGVSEKTVEAVTEVLSSGKMTPEQISQIKLAEIDFQKFLKQNAIDLEKVHAEDRNSARSLLTATRSKMPAILSIIVTLGYFGVLAGMMTGTLKVKDSESMLLMLGSLGTAWGMVMAFWFGTTSGSQAKNEMLANSVPARSG
ncbi:hypothetical protein UFOVP669_20 [uncultured Caudovirales phage]|uniref:Holin of 3TMs, for gene-transfer release n=1 Tax=uncultured Caudovirales phage TaxID=2100421 RepID=A0A6J5M0Q1_9CAUD|nr:hypothetical protein UFOVP400_11 [uncultured Caudovirales phage]CAB4155643.1 hypothetical protein UFOVP669_20 [uncultured Caudovirales phage]CAB4213564.1 hypothetical protein UFOVP1449_51 [uncultured Caudovirales phage]